MNGKQRYAAYLKSDHWQDLKARKWKKSGRKTCPGCTRFRPLQTHHMLYRKNWEDAKLLDLTLLCADCHKVYHQIVGAQIPGANQMNRGWLKAFTKKLLRVESYIQGNWPNSEPPAITKDAGFMELYWKMRETFPLSAEAIKMLHDRAPKVNKPHD